jgi:hypothetical protein
MAQSFKIHTFAASTCGTGRYTNWSKSIPRRSTRLSAEPEVQLQPNSDFDHETRCMQNEKMLISGDDP